MPLTRKPRKKRPTYRYVWKLLRPGTILKKGDEWQDCLGEWEPTNYVGEKIGQGHTADAPYRRRVRVKIRKQG